MLPTTPTRITRLADSHPIAPGRGSEPPPSPAKMEGTTGIEPVTCGSAIRCSTAELSTHTQMAWSADSRFTIPGPQAGTKNHASTWARTRDLSVNSRALCQLSHGGI